MKFFLLSKFFDLNCYNSFFFWFEITYFFVNFLDFYRQEKFKL